jgi:hypothetical protein
MTRITNTRKVIRFQKMIQKDNSKISFMTMKQRSKRQRFTPEEDLKIIQFVHGHGTNWATIEKFMDGRKSRQIR